jgi:hypothetical protein
MTLSDFATFSTAISGLAVTASLIYLALQTHQNAKHTRALIAQGRAASNIDAAARQTDSELAAAYIAVAGGTPTPDRIQMLQFLMICVTHLQNAEEVFFQHEQGLMSDEHFWSHRGYLIPFLAAPGARVYWNIWKSFRPHTQEKFKAWIDAIVEEVPMRNVDSSLDGYIAQIAAATKSIQTAAQAG